MKPELQRSSQSSRVERKQILWVMKILNPKNRLVWFNWSKRADSLCLPASYSGADISLVLLNKHQLSMRLNVFIYVQKHFFFLAAFSLCGQMYKQRALSFQSWEPQLTNASTKILWLFCTWPKRTERNATPSPNRRCAHITNRESPRDTAVCTSQGSSEEGGWEFLIKIN